MHFCTLTQGNIWNWVSSPCDNLGRSLACFSLGEFVLDCQIQWIYIVPQLLPVILRVSVVLSQCRCEIFYFRMSSLCCLCIVSLWCSCCHVNWVSGSCKSPALAVELWFTVSLGIPAMRERWCFDSLDSEVQWFNIGLLDCKWPPHWPQIRSDGPVSFLSCKLSYMRGSSQSGSGFLATQLYSYTYSEPWRHR